MRAVADFHCSREIDHRLSELVIDGFVDINPLCRDAELRTVLERCPEQLARRLFDIDIGQHDCGIVAAQLQRDPFQIARRRFHHLAPRRGRPGKADLAHVGMAGQPGAQFVAARHDVQDTRGQHVAQHLTQLQRAQRRERRRLHDDGVAGDKCRCDFPDRQQHREIPRRDRPDDAQWYAPRFDGAARRILCDMDVQTLFRDFPAPDHRSADFPFRPRAWLALFHRQQPHEIFGMRFDHVTDFRHQCLTLCNRARGPGGEGGFCCGNGFVQLRPGRIGHVRHDGLGRGIISGKRRRCGCRTAIDRHREIVEKVGHDALPFRMLG